MHLQQQYLLCWMMWAAFTCSSSLISSSASSCRALMAAVWHFGGDGPPALAVSDCARRWKELAIYFISEIGIISVGAFVVGTLASKLGWRWCDGWKAFSRVGGCYCTEVSTDNSPWSPSNNPWTECWPPSSSNVSPETSGSGVWPLCNDSGVELWRPGWKTDAPVATRPSTRGTISS